MWIRIVGLSAILGAAGCDAFFNLDPLTPPARDDATTVDVFDGMTSDGALLDGAPLDGTASDDACSIELPSCGGTHAACSTYAADGGECQDHGCTAASCSGAHDACATYTSAIDCAAHGCDGGAAQCGGTHKTCSTYNADPTGCVAHNCMFTAGACIGTPHTCAEENVLDCTANGCTVVPGVCSGTPHDCAGLDNCGTHGCGPSTCTGSPHACTTYGAQPLCASSGCTWDPNPGCL